MGLIPDPGAVRAVWDDAAAPHWAAGPALWLHGDLHPANVRTADGTFCGVIDFGDLFAGDPACDLAAPWVLLGLGVVTGPRPSVSSCRRSVIGLVRGGKLDGSRSAFRLERGVTGFRDRDDPSIPSTDPHACRAAWYAVARAARGRVTDFTEQEYPQNFHSATLVDRDGTHVALFHAHRPLIAFVRDRRYEYTDEFEGPPPWAAALGDAGFSVLSGALLLSPLEESDTSALSAAEWEQIKHWRPRTLGATLFNSWD